MQALWMLLASVMFAIMGSFVKLSAEHGASLAQVVLFRGLPSIILLLIWARAARQSIVPNSWRLHVWRNLSGVTSMWLGFYAISHLPLATATSLNYTAPLFIACWMLGWGGAQRDLVRIVAVALGFLGVIAVLRPSINDDQWLAALLGLLAGALSAIAMMQIRQLGRVGEPEWRTVLFFSLAVCLSSVAGLALQGWGSADLMGYFALVGVGTAGLFGQLAMTRAFGHGSALLTAALQYTTIIFAAFIGVGVWGDMLDSLAWAGMGLIIAAGLLSVWRTMRDPAQG
ncbi:DMT family transporter [Bordetella hinzii]|uniref:EamA/RhaT family transporter n=2 Tax=Bordetella hinzii TaxID=103855 RepID=A0AAN1RY08_9BORD|nr:DMT family transporter [Bordetella hinzii]AKQ56249.1 EamA-like transporter family protein [Bordetella hinzii]AKQ60780.1 EamA-like transporter family protein [Bordetella hinzii]AZW18196.1 EamA/RhaT family transporter [Bordetella hinzii]KCB21209.1 EamA-like transporter family protein [Bordetella hinzii OH87 BAL007II]KCB27444.1 EamA-like transporter family protein [Bordetella hinzii CA90 BAL1384]